MARNIGATCRQCRREGMKLSLKGVKCVGPSCPMNKRAYAPGMHGRRPGKPTAYAIQLREKQKVKRMYGVLEKQFRRYYDLSTRSRGATGRTMIQYLEKRLDNVIYRLLFASSRAQARQMVNHGMFTVNGKKVDIASYQVRVNDKIEVVKSEQYLNVVKENYELCSKDRSVVSWLFLDTEKLRGEVLRAPEKEDLLLPINEQLIVELYSK